MGRTKTKPDTYRKQHSGCSRLKMESSSLYRFYICKFFQPLPFKIVMIHIWYGFFEMLSMVIFNCKMRYFILNDIFASCMELSSRDHHVVKNALEWYYMNIHSLDITWIYVEKKVKLRGSNFTRMDLSNTLRFNWNNVFFFSILHILLNMHVFITDQCYIHATIYRHSCVFNNKIHVCVKITFCRENMFVNQKI